MSKDEKKVAGRTLWVDTNDGQLKIEIPAGARITFGPTIPFERKNGAYHRNDGYSLRVYENSRNDSLIAVFAGVQSFRDVTIPVSKLVVREAGTSVWKSDETGYQVERKVNVEKSFSQLDGLVEGNADDVYARKEKK